MRAALRIDTGRTNQKLRTRKALLDAARALAARGEPVTVTAAAAEAGISKATAYRYFAASDALTMEAALDGVFATAEAVVVNDKTYAGLPIANTLKPSSLNFA